MRKFLAALSAVGILSTTAVSTMAFSPSIKSNENKVEKEGKASDIQALSLTKTWDWTNVNIDHDVETAKSGTSNREDIKTSTTISKESWNNFFMKVDNLIATGIFDLHTHKKDDLTNSAGLGLQRESSNDTTRVWKFEGQNDQSNGWGHQTAYISLVVTATHSGDNLVSIETVSYIHARTAGSSSPCYTRNQVNNIKFIGEVNS